MNATIDSPTCRECARKSGIAFAMRRGFAIPPAVHCTDEGTCSEGWWRDFAPLVQVWKCPACGHSYQPSKK